MSETEKDLDVSFPHLSVWIQVGVCNDVWDVLEEHLHAYKMEMSGEPVKSKYCTIYQTQVGW